MTIKRTLFLAAGWICVALAVLGIVLPVLPTTPFLLLAAYCFSRSSDRLHAWLLSHRWFGPGIRNYRDGRGMSGRDKAVTLASLWLSILLAVCVFIPILWVECLVIAVAAGVSAHILRLPTWREETL